jgi:lipid-A-disaccharide synthase
MDKIKTIFIVAGEASGDLHGAHLARALKRLNPQIRLCGAGGKLMQNSGVEIFYNFVDLAVVGFFEVLKNLGKFKAIFKFLCQRLDEVKPDAVILVDYPGFNLRFAREVKKRNIKLIYYISPQVWAWGRNRIDLIKELVNKMIVIFKFEEELYKSHGVNAVFAGHPLLDIVKPSAAKPELCKKLNLSPNKKIIALLPGSREVEVRRHLPIFLETCKILNKKIANLQFVVSKSPALSENLFLLYLAPCTLHLAPITNSYDCIELADFVLVASGTATLETAILGKPMAIIYKTSFFTWLIAKPQIKIPYLGLVNVVAGEKIVPEFIQYDARPRKIAQKVINLLNLPESREEIKANLIKVRENLGEPGAAERAARAISEFI